MGRATKGLWKLGKGLTGVTIGAVKGVYNVGDELKNLAFGNSEILDLQQKLRVKNSEYQAKRIKKAEKYPFIDSAVLSGLTLRSEERFSRNAETVQ